MDVALIGIYPLSPLELSQDITFLDEVELWPHLYSHVIFLTPYSILRCVHTVIVS